MLRAIRLRGRHWRQPKLFFVGAFVCTLLLSLIIQAQRSLMVLAQEIFLPQPQVQLEEQLPEPQVHPLPPALAQWQVAERQGDYFSAIEPTPVGYLIWSEFPVKVFIEPVPAISNSFERDRAQAWVEAVTEAVQEWSVYLPMDWVNAAEVADIIIWRSAPPIQLEAGSNPGDSNSGDSNSTDSNSTNNPPLPRIRSAETKYHLFVDRPINAPAKLAQRFTIQLTPNQTIDYIKATARHEIGHALGIWGHSPVETDALYFSQVRSSPLISDRDVNTLRRIYEQPTRIGWELTEVDSSPTAKSRV